jgi:hypothetical protein
MTLSAADLIMAFSIVDLSMALITLFGPYYGLKCSGLIMTLITTDLIMALITLELIVSFSAADFIMTLITLDFLRPQVK